MISFISSFFAIDQLCNQILSWGNSEIPSVRTIILFTFLLVDASAINTLDAPITKTPERQSQAEYGGCSLSLQPTQFVLRAHWLALRILVARLG